jgi:sorbitol/mannitol transport system permease protein
LDGADVPAPTSGCGDQPALSLRADNLQQLRQLFQSGAAPYLINSATASVVSTLLVVTLAVPTAYALSIKPVRKWTDVMFFFLSTKFLPPIAALLPIYLIVKSAGMLDNVFTLVILYTSMNLPIAVWMMRSFLAEVPKDILEAASVDGAGLVRTLLNVVAPIAAPGLAATSLICFIFSWNEFMFAVNLTATRASTAPIFLVASSPARACSSPSCARRPRSSPCRF